MEKEKHFRKMSNDKKKELYIFLLEIIKNIDQIFSEIIHTRVAKGFW
jgi:hypothetical protein